MHKQKISLSQRITDAKARRTLDTQESKQALPAENKQPSHSYPHLPLVVPAPNAPKALAPPVPQFSENRSSSNDTEPTLVDSDAETEPYSLEEEALDALSMHTLQSPTPFLGQRSSSNETERTPFESDAEASFTFFSSDSDSSEAEIPRQRSMGGLPSPPSSPSPASLSLSDSE